jgi:ribonucleoside-diphosphate reductase subunit M1
MLESTESRDDQVFEFVSCLPHLIPPPSLHILPHIVRQIHKRAHDIYRCSEIIEFTSPTEVAVCTLASVSLPAFIKGGIFDFKDLHAVTKVAARNLDTVIDINHYPIPEAKNSNEKHRPIGIGIQGLADCFMILGYAFDSDEAALLNTQIAATMYHAAIEQSAELARDHGAYASYDGSPASFGKLQYDLWNVEPDYSTGLDWAALKRLVKKYGLRNSLSIALMPTASTSQLFGNNESFEPVTSLIYTRRTLAGEFTVINKHLVNHLVERGLWSVDVKDLIVANGGSVQSIAEINDSLKSIYKTSWEISQRVLIDQSAARGPYVCQSQSLNLFVAEASLPRLSTIHFYAWRQGLKTGCYYLRTRAASQAKQITVSESQSCIACSS